MRTYINDNGEEVVPILLEKREIALIQSLLDTHIKTLNNGCIN
jgi:hypothetical protein